MIDLKSYFHDKYQGGESFIENVILPIFGEDKYEDAYEEDVLENNPVLITMADTIGISQILRLGTINIPMNPTDVFDITVTNHVQMERNRVTIQQLVRRIMSTYSSAFMVFHYNDDDKWDWRFTFCSKQGNNQETTDSKRYTFLLGPNQSCRTAAENFNKLAGKHGEIELDDIVKAFDVESLSKEFFEKYKVHYGRFVAHVIGKEYIDKGDGKGEWREKEGLTPSELFYGLHEDEKTVRDYVKKLLGRIVFLHFLQKKGWLGATDEEWTNGPLDFMHKLFENASADQQENFLDDILEPLFSCLDTPLNQRREIYDTKVDGLRSVRVPFLGGLFERTEEDKALSIFPSELFAEFFNFLSEYNFTIDENDPNDAQVGVDPEMLGRIFENLLEDNKDKGAFYTPKEIVQYMCRESLIAYLQTSVTDEPTREALRMFVTSHDVTLLGGRDSALAQNVSQCLKDVKICDPAIGSGAFPMGLLNELFLCRGAIEDFGNATDIKRHIIQQNIYGVDIEKGAVEIARLRFWLSLIVDEEMPQALPNLDYKIVEGNSLITTFDGQYIDLSTNIGTSRLRSSLVRIRPEKKALQAEQRRFFTLSGDEKYRSEIAIKNHILNIIWYQLDYEKHSWEDATIEQAGLFGTTTTKGRKKNTAKVVEFTQERQTILDKCEKKMAELNDDSKSLQERASIIIPFFEWKTIFSDIFDNENKAGFDIVIGNPPFVVVKKTDYPSYEWNSDLYKMFFEKGLKGLICESGLLSYISPKFYLVNKDDEEMREFFMNKMKLMSLTLCNPFDVVTENVITFIERGNTGKIVPVYKHYPSENTFKRIENLNIDYSRTNPYSEMVLEISSEVIELLSRIQSSHPVIKDVTQSKRGAEVSKNYLRSNDAGLLSLIGMDMRKYSISCTNTYLDFGHKEYKRLKSFFNQDLIYLRRVDSCLEATTSNFHYGFNKNVYGIQVTDTDYDLYYVLAILNAKVTDFYYKKKFSTKKEDVFPEIQTYLYEQLPIPHATQEEQGKIIEIVDKILQNKKENLSVNTSSLESEIDRLVYQLYDLTYDEVLIVDPETPITREEYESIIV